MTVLAFWVVYEVEPPPQPPEVRVHVVGFDNRYGNLERLPIYVSVDNRPEQASVAACNPATCTFELPLPDGPHQVRIWVELDGKRSEPTSVTLDTTVRGGRNRR
jgi:hypothetical protein